MKHLIDREALIQENQVWSRDLKEYVVPIKALKQAPFIREEDVRERPETHDELLRVLFNRCFALTGPAMCVFCGIKSSCEKHRTVGKEDTKE